jgi:hypothetical protein
MKFPHAKALSLIALLAAASSVAQAQVKFADLKAGAQAKDVFFEPAKQLPAHGTLVALELANGDKVQGHVVRFDLGANELFLRTKPGTAPLVFAGNNIKQMQVASRPGEKGVRQIIVAPEIFTQVIYNGTQRSVAFASNVLSPGERDLLARLQKAENDCAALVHQRDQRELAVAQDMALQEEQVKTQRLINQTLRNENSINYPYPPATPDAAGLLTLRAFRGVWTILPQVVPSAVGVVNALPVPDAKAMAECQAELARLQSQAVYENGRLVAVVVK